MKKTTYILSGIVIGASIMLLVGATSNMLIRLGKLQTDLDGNGFSLTNVAGLAAINGITNTTTDPTAWGLNGDSSRVTTIAVATFEPVKTNGTMVVDIYPSSSDGNATTNAVDGSLVAKFDLVDRNPDTSANSSLWDAVMVGISPSGGAIIGTHSSGNLNPGQVTFWGPNVGTAFAFTTTSSNETSQVGVGSISGAGVFNWGSGSYFQVYQSSGVFVENNVLALHDNVPAEWYDSRSGLTSYCAGLVGVTNGASRIGYMKVLDSGTGYGDLRASNLVATTTISATNGYWFPTNAISSWPAAAQAPGWAFWGNSNGAQYQLISAPGSTAWVKTNLIGTVP